MVTVLQIYLFTLPFALSPGSPWSVPLHLFYVPSLLAFFGLWVLVKGLSLKGLGAVKYPVLLFFLSLVISVAFSTDREKSFHEFYFYVLFLLSFLVSFSLPHNDKVRVIKALLLGALLISLLAIHQYFVVFPDLIDYLKEKQIANPALSHYVAQKRIFYPFTTPNILGGYLAMLLPLALLLAEGRALILVSVAVALALTQSLSGLLSAFFAFAVLLSMKGRLNTRTILFLLIVMGAIIALIFFLRTTRCTEFLQPLFSGSMRFGYWRESVRVITAHPLTGVGLANFDLPQCRFAHNSYLQIWGEMGVLGIVSFLWLVGAVLVNAWHKMKEPLQRDTLLLLIASLAAFLFHNILDFSFFLPEVSLIGWVLLGLLYSPETKTP